MMPRWLRAWLLEGLQSAEVAEESQEGTEFDPDDPDNWLSLEYVHDQVLENLKTQYEMWNVTDGRLRLVLGVIGIIFAAALGLQRSTSPIPFWVGVLAIGAMTLFLIAGILVAWFYISLEFDRPQQPQSLREDFLLDEREAKLAVVDTSITAYSRNGDILARKVLAFNVAFILTAVATVLMGLAVIAQVTCQTAAAIWWPWPSSGC